jgi:hypothetical protein
LPAIPFRKNSGNSGNFGPDFFSIRPLFEVKIGVASWVRRGQRPRPAAGDERKEFITPG